MSLKITLLQSYSNFPGDNELKYTLFADNHQSRQCITSYINMYNLPGIAVASCGTTKSKYNSIRFIYILRCLHEW